MTRRIALLAAVVAALLSCVVPASAATTHPSVVVLGIPGLQWNEVTATGTPTLWRLASTGTSGALSIRSADALTCPADGWLTVGAGNRVRAGRGCAADPMVVTSSGTASVSGFANITKDSHQLGFGAVPGILATTLAGRGDCVAAIGPAAVIGAADRNGSVGHYAGQVSRPALASCPVTVVTGPIVTGAANAAAADAVAAEVDASRPPGSVLLVVGLSDTDPRGRAHLHVAIASGGAFGPGRLSSQSTRKAPYVQLIDVAATVLDLRGAPAVAAVDGQPWRRVGTVPADVHQLVDADRAAGAVRAALPWAVLLLVVLVTAGSALSLTRRRRLAALVSLVALAAPVATYLLNVTPWFRAPSPTLVTLVGTVGLALLIAVPAFRLGEARSWVVAAGAVAGLTFAVLAADVVTGSRLQMDSVLGYSPLVAGRFTGVGNVAFGVLGSAALLLAMSVAIKRPGWRGFGNIVAIGVVAVVVDGAPMWGSDVGGVLALVPGFAVLVLLCAGARLSWRRALGIGASAVAIVLGFGLLDYARPASSQTHLGRFVGRILHGGAGTVIDRKLHSDLDLLTANAGTLIVPLVVVVALWLLLRPRPRLARAYTRHPQLRYGLLALAVLALVGLVVNDSGIAIPAVAVLLGVPFVLAILTGDTSGDPRADEQHVLP
ncbi:MAG: hypothetical protein QOE24_746 [Frankiales bacterium]|nr:hypothetical protein [Frankiales bacterium]